MAGIRAISPICVPNVDRSSWPNWAVSKSASGLVAFRSARFDIERPGLRKDRHSERETLRMQLAASSDIACSM